MAEINHFCTRCGQKGVRVETATTIDYHCPTGSHGVVWRDKKEVAEPSAADLDAVADDQKQAEATGKRGPKALN